MPSPRWPRRLMSSCSVMVRPKQEFSIAVATFDRGGNNRDNAPSERGDKLGDILADAGMERGIAHDAFFHGARTNLELRLDQRNEQGMRFYELYCGRHNQFERNKADINGHKVWPFIEPGGGKAANIGGLERNDLWPGTQCLVKLGASDIDRIDKSRPTAQQYLCESAGRGADIEADAARWIEVKVVKRCRELDAASRHIRVS